MRLFGFTSAEAVYIALICVVPGYIFLIVRNQFVAGQHRLGTEQRMAFVTYSAVNFALFGWINLVVVPHEAAQWVRISVWMLTLLVGPAVLGFISGVCTQKELVANYTWPNRRRVGKTRSPLPNSARK